MTGFTLGLTALFLSAILSNVAHADTNAQSSLTVLAQSPTGNGTNPYNSPTRRANPNSMQGTQPNAPAIRGPNTVPVPRAPTLDNGGIRNGAPQNRQAPGSPPKFIPNPPARDAGTGNR